MIRRLLVLIVLALGVVSLITARAHADALERLKVEKLRVVHRDITAFKSQRQDVTRPEPFRDYRANLHVHSAFSHDSRGKIEDIVAAAKAVGTQVVMFTEHPADSYDFFADGHQGVNDGVLLVPGAEMKGFLVFPKQSLKGLDGGTPQEFADLVRGREGLMFLSHLEERMDWQIQGLTGCEIYNTHADLKDEKKLIEALKNPMWLINSADSFRKYPQEAYSALLDYPADYLKRWDQLCELAPLTGISANDAHQNIGIVVRLVEPTVARIEDALGEKLLEVNAAANPAFLPFLKGKKVGDVLFEMRLDRYEHSLRHVSTHLLMKELTKEAVWDALEAGRAYVAFDWIADPTGFDFAAVSGTTPSEITPSETIRHEMGSQMTFAAGLHLRGQSPLAVSWNVIRNGKPLVIPAVDEAAALKAADSKSQGSKAPGSKAPGSKSPGAKSQAAKATASELTGKTFDIVLTEPGNYRVEAWLRIGGKKMAWVLSNPIYIHPQ
jgi:hypothetical protein